MKALNQKKRKVHSGHSAREDWQSLRLKKSESMFCELKSIQFRSNDKFHERNTESTVSREKLVSVRLQADLMCLNDEPCISDLHERDRAVADLVDGLANKREPLLAAALFDCLKTLYCVRDGPRKRSRLGEVLLFLRSLFAQRENGEGTNEFVDLWSGDNCALLTESLKRYTRRKTASISYLEDYDLKKLGELFGTAWNILSVGDLLFKLGVDNDVGHSRWSHSGCVLQIAKRFAELSGIGLEWENSPDLPASAITVEGQTTIFLDEGLSQERQSWLICHEMAHILLDHKAVSSFGMDYDTLEDVERELFADQERTAELLAQAWIDIFECMIRHAGCLECNRTDRGFSLLVEVPSNDSVERGHEHCWGDIPP